MDLWVGVGSQAFPCLLARRLGRKSAQESLRGSLINVSIWLYLGSCSGQIAEILVRKEAKSHLTILQIFYQQSEFELSSLPELTGITSSRFILSRVCAHMCAVYVYVVCVHVCACVSVCACV